MSDSKIRIIVAAHKPYPMPREDIYLPVFVGAANRTPEEIRATGYAADNTGENISEKNGTFCELTGLYWAWKNLDAEICGLCHYRRYFGNGQLWKPKQGRLLSEEEIREMLQEADVILPHKRHYWIETRGDQYAHAHHAEDLRCAEGVLKEKCPEFLPAWQQMLNSRSGHICNMFVMHRKDFEAYCAWLFGILFEVEKRLNISSYSQNDQRVFGFLGERLLDVYIRTKNLRIKEAYMLNLEKQHWLKKGTAFIKRKLQKEK